VELSSAAGVRCGSHWEFVGPSLCEARAGVNLFSTMRSSIVCWRRIETHAARLLKEGAPDPVGGTGARGCGGVLGRKEFA
jgi:hypothetical protein